MYKVIELKDFKKSKMFNWFKTFSNPCYGFDVEIDVTNLVAYSKKSNTHFFDNMLFVVCKSLNSLEDFRFRYVENQIRLYDKINPSFTVMTELGVYENVHMKMEDDYKTFISKTRKLIESVVDETDISETYNTNEYSDFYITCIPWLSYKSMTHPLPDNNLPSSSCQRICWSKYTKSDNRYKLMLNITVSHMFIDGNPLSEGFKLIQKNIDDFENFILK